MEDSPGFPLVPAVGDDDDVDHSLAHVTSNPLTDRQSRKGKIQHINWDASLEEMQHDNNIARAQSGAYNLNYLSTILSGWADGYLSFRLKGPIASKWRSSNEQQGHQGVRSSSRLNL
jgi:hypothetical protein